MKKQEAKMLPNGVKLISFSHEKLMNQFPSDYDLMSKYLHVEFPPIKDQELEYLAREIASELPKDFIQLLKKNNGIRRYSNSIDIYGFGRVIKDGKMFVSRDPQHPLPFHLPDYNKEQSNREHLVIGSYREKALVYNLSSNSGIIELLDNGRVIESWNSINDCLDKIEEMTSRHYDDDGVVKTPLVINKSVFNMIGEK